MNEHRGSIVTAALAMIASIVTWITGRPESPRWAITLGIVVLGALLFLVFHYYFTGGMP